MWIEGAHWKTNATKEENWKLLGGECVQFMSVPCMRCFSFALYVAMCPKYTLLTLQHCLVFCSRRIYSIPFHGSVFVRPTDNVSGVIDVCINCDKWRERKTWLLQSPRWIKGDRKREDVDESHCHFISTVSEIRFYDKLMKHPLQHQTNIAISHAEASPSSSMLCEKCSFDNNHNEIFSLPSSCIRSFRKCKRLSNRELSIVSWLNGACTTRYCSKR